MSKSGSLYIDRISIFHKLDGSIKLLMLICWTMFTFMFMDARVFIVMIVIGFSMVYIAKLPLKSVLPLIIFIFVFTICNSLLLIIVTPTYGSKLTGTYTVILNIFNIKLTYETLFYAVTLSLKYICMAPLTILFIFTTEPGSFASSLNRLKVSYRVSYAVSIALRYIPNIRTELQNIINAQECKGVSFRRGEANTLVRTKNYISVFFPLLLSSLEKIDVISNAMELRSFGKYKKRTWYNRKPLNTTDFIFILLSILLIIIGIYLKANLFKRFWCIYF
ncbi:energy-coupling factor transporter transmembrane component T family protein [Clostridium akagii]|uniref:energy-coupling factor transporter transmembrane component T family protein n=1 Tax=Clostridium akagii TaxID=91623 RepID=UPI0005615837|nr:energy-coupling factor transporter transmembrane component T [Clostridium akagii]